MSVSQSLTQTTESVVGLLFGPAEDGGEDVTLQNYQGNLTPIFWIPFLLNETITVIFVINKARKSHRLSGTNRFNKPTLLDTLIQHSILYYVSYVFPLKLVATAH